MYFASDLNLFSYYLSCLSFCRRTLTAMMIARTKTAILVQERPFTRQRLSITCVLRHCIRHSLLSSSAVFSAFFSRSGFRQSSGPARKTQYDTRRSCLQKMRVGVWTYLGTCYPMDRRRLALSRDALSDWSWE